jgi:hypothetical protein
MSTGHACVWTAAWCAIATGLSGCDVFNADLLLETKTADVTQKDAGGDGDGDCEPNDSIELCNGLDDDCDGDLDEDADARCTLPGASSACSGGACVIALCSSGFVDCNERSDDGCEALASTIQCGMCGRSCGDAAVSDSGAPVGGSDAMLPDDDAGSEEGPPCVEEEEVCDSSDNDCDEKIDEGAVCSLAQCVANMPSQRGMACDACVCAECSAQVTQCQHNINPTWASQCNALVQCVVTETLAGNCDGDCWLGGEGPCAAETNIAAGGVDENDTSQVVGGCAASDPPVSACAAAINYRDFCTFGVCAGPCGN